MVELDVAGDVDDGGLAWLAGGKVGRLSWICGAVAFGAVTDAGGGARILSRNAASASSGWSGGKAATVSVAAVRACGKLIRAGGMPVAVAPTPMTLHSAWRVIQAGCQVCGNFRLAARLRERRPASRKDWVTTLSPVETGRVCIIPPDSAKMRSSTCAR
jgi:hypothetical protein